MTAALALTDLDVFIVLEAFLKDILPSGDAVFVGSIADDTLTVTNLKAGTILLGDAILGGDVLNGTLVSAAGVLSGGTGTYTVNPPQTATSALLATGVEIIQGQISRVPEPVTENFVVMTASRRSRIETNVDDYSDVVFVGSIAGTTMTVTGITRGALTIGALVFGVALLSGTKILSQSSGTPGGLGTYFLNTSQTIAGGTKLATGTKIMTQGTEFVILLDCHGPLAADIAQVISTAFRDEYAATFFSDLNPDISPLYADDPRQVPFINAEQQWEDRWSIEAHIQINPAVSIPQQFADQLSVTTINVETAYPIS